MCLNVVMAKCLANLDYILEQWGLKITGKRMFPAVIGEETTDMDYDVSPKYKGNKGNNFYRGSV